MCAPERTEMPMTSTVFLKSRVDDLPCRFSKSGVDHFEAGVPERVCDDPGATVVTVETGFGDQDAYDSLCRHRLESGFFVNTVNIPKRIADFTQSRIGADAFQNGFHDVGILARRF